MVVAVLACSAGAGGEERPEAPGCRAEVEEAGGQQRIGLAVRAHWLLAGNADEVRLGVQGEIRVGRERELGAHAAANVFAEGQLPRDRLAEVAARAERTAVVPVSATEQRRG
jgi:hypothetical protein